MSLISKETLLTHLQRAEMASDVRLPIEFFRDLVYQAMPRTWVGLTDEQMEVVKTTNEYGVTNYETEQLGIPEYCALMGYPKKGEENLSACLDGNFGLEDLKRLVAYMELIEKERT